MKEYLKKAFEADEKGRAKNVKTVHPNIENEGQTSVSETAKVSIKIGETAVAAPISMLYKS